MQEVEKVVAECVPVLLQDAFCPVVHVTRKVSDPKGMYFIGPRLQVVFVVLVLVVKLLQHREVRSLWEGEGGGEGRREKEGGGRRETKERRRKGEGRKGKEREKGGEREGMVEKEGGAESRQNEEKESIIVEVASGHADEEWVYLGEAALLVD